MFRLADDDFNDFIRLAVVGFIYLFQPLTEKPRYFKSKVGVAMQICYIVGQDW